MSSLSQRLLVQIMSTHFMIIECLECCSKIPYTVSGFCKECEDRQTLAFQNWTDVESKPNQELSEFHKRKCPICTFQNEPMSNSCAVCEHKLSDSFRKPQSDFVKCPQCSVDSPIFNQVCLVCEADLFQTIKKVCSICGFLVRESSFEAHEMSCRLSQELIKAEDFQKVEQKHPKIDPIKKYPIHKKVKNPQINPKQLKGEKNDCFFCHQPFSAVELQKHVPECQKRQEQLQRITDPKTRLTPLQTEALKHMYEVSAKEHYQTESALLARVKKLGYSKQDLENLRFYIENYAPIIIQIHISRHMQFFLKDTHYRSQFETNKSSGSLSRQSRTQWEDRMFYKQYSKATDFERVKYGVINFTNDPKGVQCASSYGPSYLLLKSHMRDRCTITDKDSSGADSVISNLRHCFKVVSKMNDKELKAAFNASKAMQESSSVLISYKQIQIHGPIEFGKDVERIYISRKEVGSNKQFLDMAYEFSEKFKVEHDFI